MPDAICGDSACVRTDLFCLDGRLDAFLLESVPSALLTAHPVDRRDYTVGEYVGGKAEIEVSQGRPSQRIERSKSASFVLGEKEAKTHVCRCFRITSYVSSHRFGAG